MTEAAPPAAAPPAAPPAAAPPAAPPAPAAPWYGDKIPEETRGFWQTKGLDVNDPIKVSTGLTEFYRNIEKLVGVKPEELIRLPKPNAEEAEIKAFRTRLGVPAEAKDYDFSTIKRADGKEIPASYFDTARAALFEAGVPKDRAGAIVDKLVKHQEERDKANLADVTANIAEQKTALDRSWGQNKQKNLVLAQAYLEQLGKAANISGEELKQAWDALTVTGGLGAAKAMEMLLAGAVRTLEPNFITGGGLQNDQQMTREGAQAEIEALKRDTGFGQKLKAGDRESMRRWQNLHKIAHGQAAA